MATGKDWQPSNIRPVYSEDRTLDGAGFTVYSIRIEPGVTKDKPGRSFIVVCPSSLPSPADLWQSFSESAFAVNVDVDSFVELLRLNGYVQIEQHIHMILQY